MINIWTVDPEHEDVIDRFTLRDRASWAATPGATHSVEESVPLELENGQPSVGEITRIQFEGLRRIDSVLSTWHRAYTPHPHDDDGGMPMQEDDEFPRILHGVIGIIDLPRRANYYFPPNDIPGPTTVMDDGEST